jgi:hypothetical protein
MKIFHVALFWWTNSSGWRAAVEFFLIHLFHDDSVSGGPESCELRAELRCATRSSQPALKRPPTPPPA